MSTMIPSIAHDIAWLENKHYPEMLTGFFRDALLKKMRGIQTGCAIIEDRNSRYVLGDLHSELKTPIRVHNRQFYPLLVLRGSLGAAESYIRGYWSTDDLVTVFRILLRNLDTLTGLEKGMARLMRPVQKIHYAMKSNTLKGSKKNILAHYDLSNDFYKLFLDESMTYSAGIFTTPDTTLEEAQYEKLDRLCRKLNLQPHDQVLEIGTGWGSLALHAATHYGCHVTTTTISDAQYTLAKERIEAAGLTDKITLLKQDYRQLEGQYDKLVSIEMIEAVGHKYIPTYFQHCSRLLKPDGIMALQGITLADQHFDTYLNTIDFIKKYVFPGACLISQQHVLQVLKDKTDLRVVHLEDIALDYAKTLKIWRERFFENIEAVKNLGFSEAFIRLWEFYLTYCEGGFREQYIGDIQLVLAKSGNVNLKIN